MENCVAPGLDKFQLLLEVVLYLARVPIFAQERIYHVRTEMRQSLVHADFALRYLETCL